MEIDCSRWRVAEALWVGSATAVAVTVTSVFAGRYCGATYVVVSAVVSVRNPQWVGQVAPVSAHVTAGLPPEFRTVAMIRTRWPASSVVPSPDTVIVSGPPPPPPPFVPPPAPQAERRSAKKQCVGRNVAFLEDECMLTCRGSLPRSRPTA